MERSGGLVILRTNRPKSTAASAASRSATAKWPRPFQRNLTIAPGWSNRYAEGQPMATIDQLLPGRGSAVKKRTRRYSRACRQLSEMKAATS
ncbi:hypothetical protein RHEC894_CH02701 [Rhizobium sp. CIAT894]|nr:hypothetical protein RHEC894_CH02701 [Rhizobium sp. CIAT894]